MCGSCTALPAHWGLAGQLVNLKPNTSLARQVWCEDLICGFCLTLHFIPSIYYISTVKPEDWKTEK